MNNLSLQQKEKNFFDVIKKRSDENEKAIKWLLQEKIYSLVGSIIRMELDSLVRVTYLNSKNYNEKEMLLSQFFNGQRWQDNQGYLTDANMLNYLMTNPFMGWARPIYDIGCAFIHLSPYHDWGNSEPTRNLSRQQRLNISNSVNEHVRCGLYKKYNKTMNENFIFKDLIEISEDVFYKLRDNLLCELDKGESR